jgi:hypothetical protein
LEKFLKTIIFPKYCLFSTCGKLLFLFSPFGCRIESKAEIRKQVAQELRRSGAWQQMREEMKSRVFKVASEKFKTGKKDAMTSGKFEFCNALYVNLMEEIHASLADLFFKVS